MESRLEFISGQGYSHLSQNGVFEVRLGSGSKKFNKLSDARKFYDSQIENKSIWDVRGVPELLESHALINKENEV